ncbi:MAG: ABC-2 transporter permease [Saccharofermentanales bacterium]
MIAVFKREFHAYFHSPLGYVFIAVMYFFTAYYFFMGNLVQNTTDMSFLFNQLFTVVLFLVPILTMRLMSEDQRAGTNQILFTSPVSRLGIVCGKYFAAFAVYLMSISGALIMALIVEFFSKTDWPVVIGHLIGLILLGASLIAICLFLSGLTESQVIAAVSGFAASLSLVLIDALVSVVSGKTFKTLFMYMSFNNRYHGFTIGIIDFSNVVFFLSIAALFVLLTGAGLEKRRWN